MNNNCSLHTVAETILSETMSIKYIHCVINCLTFLLHLVYPTLTLNLRITLYTHSHT